MQTRLHPTTRAKRQERATSTAIGNRYRQIARTLASDEKRKWHRRALCIEGESEGSGIVRSVADTFPRPLTEREGAVLALLLSAEFPGRAALASQVRHAEVHKQWPGEATIEIAVRDGEAAVVVGRVPVETSTIDDAFGILLHVIDGRLRTLEIYGKAVSDLPSEFPAPSALRPPTVAVPG